MRRSIDDDTAVAPPSGDDVQSVSWSVAIGVDYDDAEPRVIITVEPIGAPGTGVAAHVSPGAARRLRTALRDALREIGEPTGD